MQKTISLLTGLFIDRTFYIKLEKKDKAEFSWLMVFGARHQLNGKQLSGADVLAVFVFWDRSEIQLGFGVLIPVQYVVHGLTFSSPETTLNPVGPRKGGSNDAFSNYLEVDHDYYE